jgi:hypothetical protein
MSVSTAKVLTMGFLDPFAGKPVGNLIVADDHRARPLGDGNAVAHVIPVSVTDEDEICLHRVRGNRGGRVSIEKWIDNDFISISFKSKSGVPIPGQFRGHENLLLN